MSPHPRQTLVSVLMLLALIVQPLSAAAPPLAHATPAAQSDPAGFRTPEGSSFASGALFRTTVTADSPSRRARLEALGVVVLASDQGSGDSGQSSVTVLADADQLADLARLGFRPQASEDLAALTAAAGPEQAWLAASLKPLLAQAEIVQTQRAAAEIAGASAAAAPDVTALRAAMQALTPEQMAGIAGSPSVDDDTDGLTNTQEQWWCTNPLIPDTDGDGTSDGAEVQAAKDWLANRRAGPPASGKPFAGWPPQIAGCRDDDKDSVPDLAERWELGLNMNRESTDRDKFDDGQELFGLTHCPGGGFCGYGALPRNEDWGVIFAEMPSWVKAPGNHPLVAAFPVPEVDVVPSSLHVETVTTVTTDHTIASGTEKSYSTARTEGTSTSVSNTETWSDWQEVSVERTSPLNKLSDYATLSIDSDNDFSLLKGEADFDATAQVGGSASAAVGLVSGSMSNNVQVKMGDIRPSLELTFFKEKFADYVGSLADFRNSFSNWLSNTRILSDNNICIGLCGSTILGPSSNQINERDRSASTTNRTVSSGESALTVRVNAENEEVEQVMVQRLYPLVIPLNTPQVSRKESKGNSVGGARTTTTGRYEEHTITNGEAFSSGESWSTATAVNSAHAANLWFTYKVRNTGTEYAREIADLAFNVYIGDDPNPAVTYFVGPDLGGDGKFRNFMPGEEHTYTSRRIPLTLEQMKAVDLGGPVRIVVEDFTYGIDELFYQDAVNAGVLLAMEDGTDDGDELIDTYLIPTWGEETVLDVLARYFPHTTDADGNLVAIWTPEYRSDTPAWCVEPNRVGAALWCKHALSTADWWNVYTNGLGDGSDGFQDTPAAPGSVALFRFNQDSDLDGYSDRSEERLGTDPDDPASFPKPELIAGVHSTRSGNQVTATLSLLNTGLYDAYGVEAVMIAPDDSVSITNNTVGGSGRVRAQKQVIVGSRIVLQSPLPAQWTQSGHARPAVGGYYTGNADRTYTFTVQCTNPGGCDVSAGTWSLAWNDGAGASGTLNFGSGYKSPTFLDVGTLGVKLALYTGKVYNNESFTAQARTPRDTFQYTINRVPYTEPVVIVSYNDPQGNHRFVTPVRLGTPTENLIAYRSQMLQDPGVEIVTTAAFTAGANTTNLVVNNPTEVTLTNARLFLEFIDPAGTVVSEVPTTVPQLPPGPTVQSVAWNSASFNPPYDPAKDYIVMAFWTDYQGNILDTAARPLSSFQEDPKPAFAMTAADAAWDFGAASQGTLLKRSFTFANTGSLDLLTYVSAPAGLTVSQTGSRRVGMADMTTYEMALNTASLAVGPYDGTITIRTSDPANPTRTVRVTGNITAAPCDGFIGTYFGTQDLTGAPLLTRCDELLNFDWGTGSPDASIPTDHFSARWTKQIQVPAADTYTFDVHSDDGVRIYVDDQLVVDAWYDQAFGYASGSKLLSAGLHSLRVDWYENRGSAAIRLVYGPSGTRMYPLDWPAPVSGMQGQWVEFTHTLGPETQTLHPVKVYSQDYATLWGVGKYATPFGAGTASYDMFGDGRDGVMPSSGNLDYNNGVGVGVVNGGSAGSYTVNVTDAYGVWRINPGDVVLIHQTQGSSAGCWEINRAVSDFGGGTATYQLQNPLKCNYASGGNNRAQIQRVPQYTDCPVSGTVTPLTAWNGTWGGILAVMCNGTMNVTGSITVGGKGFQGGVTSNTAHAEQGDSTTGNGINSTSANGTGGGGGALGDGAAAGGGGGGGLGSGGIAGQPGARGGGAGGTTGGSADLTTLIFGGAGGGGGWRRDTAGGTGGNSGGIIFLSVKTLAVGASASVTSAGSSGSANSGAGDSAGGGGGGAGGSILLKMRTGTLGTNLITAPGGNGGAGRPGSNNDGGAGGVGRIRVEYCDTLSGSTNPPASTQKLNCYIAEQIESAPYDRGRLNLPASGANTYQVQYGRKLNWGGGANQVTTLRVPAGLFTAVTLQALVSGLPSNAWFALDVGNTGTDSWNGTVGNGGEYTSPNLAAFFNAYWASRGAPTTGTLDVPVRVYLDRAGQVLLTNLQVTPTGSKTRFIRLPVRPQGYSNVTASFTVSGGSGPLAVGVDVGGDGSVDWTYTGTPAYPARLTTGNLAAAVNAYLAGRSGEVDVPIRFHIAPFLSLDLADFTATPSAQPDLTLTAANIAFGASNPTEGETVPITATLRNNGGLDTGGLTAAFYATAPGWGEWYIGSVFVPNVPAGGTAQATIPWNTLGFIGTVPVRVVVDPYNRVLETNEENNQATAGLTIRTRPDLQVTQIALSDDEPMAGETVTVTLTLRNHGQTPAAASTISLNDDNIQHLIPNPPVPALSTVAATFVWTPSTPGRYRLFARADKDNAVNEYDEGNNDTWRDVYVGLASPVRLDSGGGDAYDPVYTPVLGFGYLDGQSNTFCGTDAGRSQRSDFDGTVRYRFDHLLPGHFYHLDLTLYECDGLGRQQQVRIDDQLISTVIDLSDGRPKRLSFRLDPAFYADRGIVVSVQELTGNDAVVSEINLYDVDYRYSDAGAGTEPAYSPGRGYGWLDGVAQNLWGSLPYQTRRIDLGDSDPSDDPDNELRYRFDGLRGDKRYQLLITVYQGAGTATVRQTVAVDSVDTGVVLEVVGVARDDKVVDVPLGTYSDDGTITVRITRLNAAAGAFINEIALEELTLLPEQESQVTQSIAVHTRGPNWFSFNVKPPVRPAAACTGVTPTSAFTTLYGAALLGGANVSVGALVEVYTPAGVKVGCFKVTTAGLYGYMRVYGAEGATPGMQPGEPIFFKINGIAATPAPYPVIWQNDKGTHEVNLAAPDVIPVETLLAPVAGQYSKLQCETGTYLPPPADPRFNTCTTVAPGQGYLLWMTAAGALAVTGDRVPMNTPVPLHAGYNWLGYLPTCELTVATALAGIAGKYTIVHSEVGTYRPPPANPAFNNFNTLAPGRGYMIYMTQAATLVYPANLCGTGLQGAGPTEAPAVACSARPTSRFTHFYGQVAAPAGAEVVAYSPRGEVVGCGRVGEEGLLPYLRVYGAEDDVPGMQTGEPIRFTVAGQTLGVRATWRNDWDVHRLGEDAIPGRLFLPLIVH